MSKKRIKRNKRQDVNILGLGNWLTTTGGMAANPGGLGLLPEVSSALDQTPTAAASPKGFNFGAASAGLGALSGATGMLAGGNTTGVGSAMQTVGGLASAIPGIGGVIGAGVGALGSLGNAAFGSNINQGAVAGIQGAAQTQGNTLSGATSNAGLMQDMSSMSKLANVSKGDVGTQGWFSNKASDKAASLNEEINAANSRRLAGISNTAGNIESTQNMNLLANYKANGGQLFNPDSGNGVTQINEGGTHEQNPNQGVPMGIGSNGKPNLVEEGEVKYEDYIFSNRITPKSLLLEKVGLDSKLGGKSFADIATKVSKESDERPYDPISQRGLKDSMGKLQNIQEMTKQVEQGNSFAKGGNLFANGGPDKPPAFGDTFASTVYNDPMFTRPAATNVPPTRDPVWGVPPMNPLEANKIAMPEFTAPEISPINTGTSEDIAGIPQPRQGFDTSMLRYAPVVSSGINALTDVLGKTNRADYSNADMIANARRDVSADPIGNYMTYNPFDREYASNKLRAQTGATRRALRESSGGNRATYAANVLAADRSAQDQAGDLTRSAEELNLAQRQQVEGFNRGTNIANVQSKLQADIFNAQQATGTAAQVAQLRDVADMRSSAARSANLTNLASNIGGIGQEAFSRNMINENPALYYSLTGTGKTKYKRRGK